MPRYRTDTIAGHQAFIVALCRRLKVRCLENVPLAPRTTWRMGGPARWLVQPEDGRALSLLLRALPAEVPRLVLGGGSNLLIVDDGFQGVVLDLTHRMNRILPPFPEEDGAVLLQVDAGVSTRTLAHFARHRGLTGVEFLGGIPGSVGGALRMNAGAFGGEVRDILVDVLCLDAEGGVQTLSMAQLGMGYRKTQVPADWTFLSARFRLRSADPAAVLARMRALNRKRREKQPLSFPSAGSTFKNPPEGPAWRWIEAAGLRGVWEGRAQVSEQHSNFLINRGGAQSRDMRTLIRRVQEQVLKTEGVHLVPEVGIIGPFGPIEA